MVERHLVRRAAVSSVRLERIEHAHESSREGAAREAVRRWEEKQRHRARRKGQDLMRDPIGTVADLEASAFGCDWLARQWRSLGDPLRLGRAWDPRDLAHAQRLLGFTVDSPGVDGDPAVRWLWILAAAANPARVGAIPRLGDEVDLPTDPAEARVALRAFVAAELDRLEALREAHWEAVAGPDRLAVAAQAAAADTSKDGQLRQRYEASAERSCNAALRLFLNVRDRRRRELLAIAKEAASSGDSPKAPVGGGWWREVDSEPAPPGFARVEPTVVLLPAEADAAPASIVAFGPQGVEPVRSDGFADEPEAPGGDGPEQPAITPPPAATPTRHRPDPAGAPRRSEPISGANPANEPRHNAQNANGLHNTPHDRPPGDRRRTEPRPPLARIVREVANRPG